MKIFANKLINQINEAHQGYHAGDNCCSNVTGQSVKGTSGAGPRT